MTEMRAAEDRCFHILERELTALPFTGAFWERRPVDPGIQTHANYSLLHSTKTPARPQGLSPEETYMGRSNLVYVAPGSGRKAGVSVAINAHIDVVAPYFPPRVRGGIVYSRGACDDKGPLVTMVAALKVVSEVMAQAGLKWNRNVVAMFVIEEETGGNGSLSLAADSQLKQLYDSVLIGEPTSLKIHPANRGAVWYRAELRGCGAPPQSVATTPTPRENNIASADDEASCPPSATGASQPREISTFEMSAFVIEELENEGGAIRAESRHELFPQRPVQTCHGIIGPFGEHPSRICGKVSFKIQFARHPGKRSEALLRDCLENGLASYIGLYGDKTKVTDMSTGKRMVVRHYDVRRSGSDFEVTVHGATGHMGAVQERDGAITKMAHLVRSLIFSKAKLEAMDGPVRFELSGASNEESLVLEGGQGFVPTHGIEEVMERMRRAAERGAENYLRRCGRNETGAQVVTVIYEKLHNAAFDGDPASPTMLNAITAANTCGLWKKEPVIGWTVSCDARLFATEYPGMPVLTFGPGELAFAHSDQEQISVKDLTKAVDFLSLFLLLQTGTLAKI